MLEGLDVIGDGGEGDVCISACAWRRARGRISIGEWGGLREL